MKKIILALASLVCSVSAHGVQINGNQISSNTAISVSSITLFNGGVLVTTGSITAPTINATTATIGSITAPTINATTATIGSITAPTINAATATINAASISSATFSTISASSGVVLNASGVYRTLISSANITNQVSGVIIVSTITVSKILNIGLVISHNSCGGVLAYNGCAPGLIVISGGCSCSGENFLEESAPGASTGNDCTGFTLATSGQGKGWGCNCSIGTPTTNAWSICARVGAN